MSPDRSERHRIEIGTIVFFASGDIAEQRHRLEALSVVGEVSREFERRKHPQFLVAGEFGAPILTVFVDGVTFEPGSLKTIATVAAIVGGISTGLANYDEAKEGITQIMDDLRSVASHVIQHAPEPRENGRPIDVSIYTRPEEDIEEQLQKSRK